MHYLLASGTLDDLMWRLITRKVAVLGRTLDGKSGSLRAGHTQAPSARLCPGCGDPEATCTCIDVDPSSALPPPAAVAAHRGEGVTGIGDAAADAEAPPDTATLKEALAAVRPPEYVETDVRFWLTGGGAKRRQSAEAAAPWSCPACTFLNSGHKCEMCDTKRPSAKAAVTTPEPTDDPDAGLATTDESKPTRTVQFCVSAKTGRIFLFDTDGNSLGAAVTQAEALDDEALREALPPDLQGKAKEIKRFATNFSRLRAVDQRELGDKVVPSAKATAHEVHKRLSFSGPAKSGGNHSVLRCVRPLCIFLNRINLDPIYSFSWLKVSTLCDSAADVNVVRASGTRPVKAFRRTRRRRSHTRPRQGSLRFDEQS